jgi:hypothetical protein
MHCQLRMESRAGNLWIATWIRCIIVFVIILAAACSSRVVEPEATMENPIPLRDINAVLEEHDEKLMAIPGVVGVYVGLLEDDQTTCLKVMAVKKTRELERAIPKSLEGHPVVIEETGVIRPLEDR